MDIRPDNYCCRRYASYWNAFLFMFVVYSLIFAGSLESANSSILAMHNLFKDFGGKKIRIL